jgi:LmbE family N-acetylglucosaminyl deacetylase
MPELANRTPERALAVYAHPDDADVGCGGTLARWIKEGCEVHVIICTDGARGTLDPKLKPVALARKRAQELADANAVVGVTHCRSLGLADGELEDTREFRRELVRTVREVRPDIVLGHDPTAIFFGQAYFNHRDHRILGMALLDAVSPTAALPLYFPDAGPPHQVSTMYLSGTLEPDVWIDVTDTIDVKAAAVECHASQFAGGEGWAGEAIRRRAEEEGRRAGVRFAEAFRCLRLGA